MTEPIAADDLTIGITRDWTRIGFAFRIGDKESRFTVPAEKAGNLAMSLLAIAGDPRAVSIPPALPRPAEPGSATLALPVEGRTVGRGAFVEAVTIAFLVPGNMELKFQLPVDDAEGLARAISATVTTIRDQANRPVQ